MQPVKNKQIVVLADPVKIFDDEHICAHNHLFIESSVSFWFAVKIFTYVWQDGALLKEFSCHLIDLTNVNLYCVIVRMLYGVVMIKS